MDGRRGESQLAGTRTAADRTQDAALRVCLADPQGGPNDALRRAVGALADLIGRSDRTGQVHNPALVIRGLRATGLPFPVAARRSIAALGLREETRSAIAAEQSAQLDGRLDSLDIRYYPVRGWRFARTYYPEPLARHCHALRWLVTDPSDSERLETMLVEEGWTAKSASPLLVPHKTIFGGQGKISVEIHSRPFPWTSLLPSEAEAAGPVFAVAELLGASLVEGHARTGRWAIDLVHLLRRADPDPLHVADIVERYGFSCSAGDRLGLLADLATASEAAVQQRIAALHRAVSPARGRAARDARPVRRLRATLAMATLPRTRFLLSALGRPDLLLPARAVRKEQAAGGARTVHLRTELRNQLRGARVTGG